MGSPKRVLAPMVGQSELAFRELVRRYGCDLAVTPMIHARLFGECDKLRRDVLRDLEGSVEAGDRPPLVSVDTPSGEGGGNNTNNLTFVQHMLAGSFAGVVEHAAVLR